MYRLFTEEQNCLYYTTYRNIDDEFIDYVKEALTKQ